MKNQSPRLLSVLALLFAACAPAQPVAKVYENPRIAGKTYTTILVVGALGNADRRRRFENDVVRSFAAQNVSAVSAIETLGGDQALNRDVLAAAAQSTGSDAVLITRLLDARTGGEVPASATTVSAERPDDQPLADFFRYNYVDDRDPIAVNAVLTVLVASDLYDVASEKKVWTAQSTAFPKNNVDAASADVANAVARSLRAGGWLD